MFPRRARRVPTIPVVSLIDILTLLLIFFTVTTTFKKKDDTAALKITLPTASALQAQPSVTEKIVLVITADGQVALDGQPTALEALGGLLTTKRQTDATKKIDLRADTELPLGQLVKVWDAMKVAGYDVNKDVTTKIQIKRPNP